MTKQVLSELHHIPQALIVSVLIILSFLYIRDNRGKTAEKLKKLIKYEGWLVLFLFYVAYLLTSAVLTRKYDNPLQDVIGPVFLFQNGRLNTSTLANIIVFIPYIYLYIKAFKPHQVIRKSILVSLGTTVFIELCQLFFCLGLFQLADIVHNIMGGMIGCGLWYVREKRLISRGWKKLRIIRQMIISPKKNRD